MGHTLELGLHLFEEPPIMIKDIYEGDLRGLACARHSESGSSHSTLVSGSSKVIEEDRVGSDRNRNGCGYQVDTGSGGNVEVIKKKGKWKRWAREGWRRDSNPEGELRVEKRGANVTDVALEWAEKNVTNNPHISELIEIRKVESCPTSGKESDNGESACGESNLDLSGVEEQAVPSSSSPFDQSIDANIIYHGPPVLLGVVRDGEKFDFCMCNSPFFEIMEAAGLNPKISCGRTPKEMVCPGGEKAFISRIIEDSVAL
ncbi:hypothetical protein LWI29_011994 [Acer saccharum]|uniref:Uncharacterized protein n=1 Tax=Acer saccharum TaxID=4024 RepID=A0AA39VK82_ACESA|nr:hypothetical protein LWI29_011994 [Acer saccharum]